MLQLPEAQALSTLTRDGRLLFVTRTVRMFAYGGLALVLALYLAQIGLHEQQIGLLFAVTLIGDAVISLWLASQADRVGRRRILLIGSALMIFAGVVFALTSNIVVLTIAAIIGTISPNDKEVGPFSSIEQAALPQTTSDVHRTQVFAWYNLCGSFAVALGALAAGTGVSALQHAGVGKLDSYRAVVIGYGLLGVVLAFIFTQLSPAVETAHLRANADDNAVDRGFFGLHRSRSVVFKLSGLFMLDAFAGGLIVTSLIAFWFYVRFGVEPAVLGGIFFGANILAGLSALAAARVAARFGLINTMVWTHIPSNILLMMVPLMPTLPLAIIVLLARFSISQMDVPTRQSYTMAVVDPDERSAAAGFTTVARTAASALAPGLTGVLLGMSLLSAPFFLSGGLKIVYDLLLYRSFKSVKPPEEAERGTK
jgi:MFS family permease